MIQGDRDPGDKCKFALIYEGYIVYRGAKLENQFKRINTGRHSYDGKHVLVQVYKMTLPKIIPFTIVAHNNKGESLILDWARTARYFEFWITTVLDD